MSNHRAAFDAGICVLLHIERPKSGMNERRSLAMA